MEIYTAASEGQAQVALWGVIIGAAVSLLVALIGNLAAPIVLEIVKDRRAAKREARQDRREGIRRIQERAMRAALSAPAIKGAVGSPQHEADLREFGIAVGALTLGLGPEVDNKVRSQVLLFHQIDSANRGRWPLAVKRASQLDVLIDQPEKWSKVLDATSEMIA